MRLLMASRCMGSWDIQSADCVQHKEDRVRWGWYWKTEKFEKVGQGCHITTMWKARQTVLGAKDMDSTAFRMFLMLPVLRVCTSGMDSFVNSEAPGLHFPEKNFLNAPAYSWWLLKVVRYCSVALEYQNLSCLLQLDELLTTIVWIAGSQRLGVPWDDIGSCFLPAVGSSLLSQSRPSR